MKRLYPTLSAMALTLSAITPMSAEAGAPKAVYHQARAAAPHKGWSPVEAAPVAAKPFGTRAKAMLAPEAADALPEINGNVLYPTTSPAYLTMATLPAMEGMSFKSLSPSGIAANGGGVLIDGVYYCGSVLSGEGYEEYFLFSFDADTWQQLTYTTTTIGMIATDMALDPTDGKVYGCFYSDDGKGSVFGTIDFATETRTPIASLDVAWAGCAVGSDGYIYAIDYNGNLVTASKTDGTVTTIGSTGLKPAYLSSACIDPYTDRMFFSYSPADESGWLYEIDTATAEATPVYRFPNNEEVVGMYVCPPRAGYEAPAAVSDAALNFDGASLSGTVTFKAPTHLYGGAAATGALTYSVKSGDEELASGDTEFGATVTAPVKVGADGAYTFSITVSNDKGASPAVEIERYIGADTPKAPVVKAVNAAGTVTVSWEAVTEGVHGGFLDPDKVTYTVVRATDGTVIARDIIETSVVDKDLKEPEEMVQITYSVTATSSGHTSTEGVSAPVAFGPFIPPYKQTFDSADAMADFTIIDANKDSNAWYWFGGVNSDGSARIRYNSRADMDDWLITPAVRLEAGKLYMIHFDCQKEGSNANIKERIEVKYGLSNTAEGMTETAITPTDVTWNTLSTLDGRLQPTVTGNYYIGFHGISPKDMNFLQVDNIVIEAGAFAKAPDAVTNFTVTPATYGRHQAEIACNMPIVCFDGTPLETITKAEILRDGETVHTVDNPAPGALMLFTDTEIPAGDHTYTVVATNEAGPGKISKLTVYIGTKTPAAPRSATLSETSTRGEVKISWTAPDKDIEGNAIDPAQLSYIVVRLEGDRQIMIAENHKGLSLTHTPYEPGTHAFATYAVFARSEGGISGGILAGTIPVGEPDALPYTESVPDGVNSHLLNSITTAGNGRWGTLKDSSYAVIASADGDNGYLAMSGAYQDAASLLTGKIDLTTAAEPVLRFSYFNLSGSEPNENTLEVTACNGVSATPLTTIKFNELTGEPNVWHTVEISLAPFKGTEPWLSFNGTIESYSLIPVDNITVIDKSSGIDLIDTGSALSSQATVATMPGAIVIEGAASQAVSVADAAGRTVYATSSASDRLEIPAGTGIYLVKVGESVHKVAVR